MKIHYNKTDVEQAIIKDLKGQGFNLEGKVVKTERVKDLIHVTIEDEAGIFDAKDSTIDLD